MTVSVQYKILGEFDPITVRVSDCGTYIVIEQTDGTEDTIHLDVPNVDELCDCIQQIRKGLVV